MSGQLYPIFLNLIAALMGATGQFFYQRGGKAIGEVPLWRNYDIALGILSFCIVMFLFVKAYQAGGRISVVYPFYATTFIWGYFIGVWFNKEPLSFIAMSGLMVMLIGISMIAYSIK